jgi:hypothetical protein
MIANTIFFSFLLWWNTYFDSDAIGRHCSTRTQYERRSTSYCLSPCCFFYSNTNLFVLVVLLRTVKS